MQLGMIGLGRMGANMVRRLARGGHECLVYDVHAAAIKNLLQQGVVGASSLEDLVVRLDKPRAVWLMVPAALVDDELVELAPLLEPGDIVVDGGNSYYRDDIRRGARLKARGIHYVDVGTSGGVAGLERGYCLMIGGEKEPVRHLAPIFAALAPGAGAAPPTPGRGNKDSTAEQGYLHCGPQGAGHFVKMVHNGIEYGLMQAYAEGFEVMKSSEFDLDLHEIAGIWRYGSVVRSWLLELLHAAFEKEGSHLEKIRGYVQDSGEGRWTIHEAIAEDVPVPVITAALFARFASRQDESFAAKVNAALRNQFGGHAVEAAK